MHNSLWTMNNRYELWTIIYEQAKKWAYTMKSSGWLSNEKGQDGSSARAKFWDQLMDVLPPMVDEHWCIGGDFKMIEVPFDWVGGSHAIIQGSELPILERLCMSLWIEANYDLWFINFIDSLKISTWELDKIYELYW